MPGMFGGGGVGDAAVEAARIQAEAAERAAQWQYKMYQEAAAREQPWVTVGGGGTPEQRAQVGGALGQLAGLYGLPGYAAVDPTATLQATPGYNWLLGEGVRARDLSAASRGLALSGAQQRGLTNWGQNLAQTYAWAPYMAGLTNLSSWGQAGAALQGNQGLATGELMGKDWMAGAGAQAQGVIAQALANAGTSAGWSNLLGMGLSAGLKYLLPGAGSALSSLWGAGADWGSYGAWNPASGSWFWNY